MLFEEGLALDGLIRRAIALVVICTFSITTIPGIALASRAEQTPLEKIAAAEQMVYGQEQTGSLVERTNKMEKDLFGLPGREALMAKVERLENENSFLQSQVKTLLAIVGQK